MWFCALPFSHIYTDPAGRYGLCCVSKLFSTNINEIPLKEHFFSDYMKSIREEMLSGKLDKVNHFCSKCIQQEKDGNTSYRTLWSNDLANHMTEDRFMFFKLSIFGNYCNLSCYMCMPVNSSRRTNDLIKLNWLDEFSPEKHKKSNIDDIIDQLKPFLPNTIGFSIMGGEPLLIKKHYKFLDKLIELDEAKNLTLNYTSNLSLNLDKFISYIPKFKKIRMNVSIDGYKERNDYIRFGSKFDDIMDNVVKLKQHCEVNIYYTVSILSVFSVDKIDANDYNIVDTPNFLSVRHLPDNIKQKLNVTGKVLSELNKPRDELQWQKAVRYIRDLDKTRKIKAKDIFTELRDYL